MTKPSGRGSAPPEEAEGLSTVGGVFRLQELATPLPSVVFTLAAQDLPFADLLE